jgi:glycosyltransferase involved in cell wall biosynthesis
MNRRGDTIGFLTQTKEWGGAEVHTAAVARALKAQGRRSVILQLGHEIYSAPERAVASAGVDVVPVALPIRLRESRPAFWRDLIHRHNLDTVVLVKGSFSVRWSSLDRAMLLRSRRYLRIEHASLPPRRMWKPGRHLGGRVPGLGLWYLRHTAGLWLHRAASERVIAVSRSIGQSLVDDYHYRHSRVTIIQNGVDSSRFVADPAAAARARARWNIPAGAYVVGTVARLAPQKRLDRLLEAFKLLAADAPNVYLVLVGAGPEEEALRAQADRLGLSDRCRWAGVSSVPSQEYSGFDCFAMTSEVEGLPYALLEAMACERMVVAMEAPGVSEVLTDPGTGRLVAADVGAFASALAEVMAAAPEFRAEVGARARRHVQEHHEARRQIEAVCAVIQAPEP